MTTQETIEDKMNDRIDAEINRCFRIIFWVALVVSCVCSVAIATIVHYSK